MSISDLSYGLYTFISAYREGRSQRQLARDEFWETVVTEARHRPRLKQESSLQSEKVKCKGKWSTQWEGEELYCSEVEEHECEMKGIPWDKELYKNTARWVPTPESVQVFRVQVLHRMGQGEYIQTPSPPPAHPFFKIIFQDRVRMQRL